MTEKNKFAEGKISATRSVAFEVLGYRNELVVPSLINVLQQAQHNEHRYGEEGENSRQPVWFKETAIFVYPLGFYDSYRISPLWYRFASS